MCEHSENAPLRDSFRHSRLTRKILPASNGQRGDTNLFPYVLDNAFIWALTGRCFSVSTEQPARTASTMCVRQTCVGEQSLFWNGYLCRDCSVGNPIVSTHKRSCCDCHGELQAGWARISFEPRCGPINIRNLDLSKRTPREVFWGRFHVCVLKWKFISGRIRFRAFSPKMFGILCQDTKILY